MRELSFCFGNNRNSLTWRPGKMTFDELYDKVKTPLSTPETVAQYRKMTKSEKQEIKDKGGFMTGTLKGVRRKKDEVVSRSMITLDCDTLDPSFLRNTKRIINMNPLFIRPIRIYRKRRERDCSFRLQGTSPRKSTTRSSDTLPPESAWKRSTPARFL